MEVLTLLLSGAVAGTLAGLLGIGGGVIIVPVLAMVFEAQGISIDVLMHVSIGTSLATIVITSISSIRAHQKRQAIDWRLFRTITPGIMLGGFLGAAIAKLIPGEQLRLIFSVVMLLIAAQMYFGNASKPHRKLPGTPGILAAGGVIGAIASMVGVGGGSMSVPFLTWCNVSIRNAVATSAAIGLPIAIAGTSGFIVSGWGVDARPVWSLGYVNLPAFFSIVAASTLFAPVGAWLTHRISPVILKRFFAFFLLILGLRMLFT